MICWDISLSICWFEYTYHFQIGKWYPSDSLFRQFFRECFQTPTNVSVYQMLKNYFGFGIASDLQFKRKYMRDVLLNCDLTNWSRNYLIIQTFTPFFTSFLRKATLSLCLGHIKLLLIQGKRSSIHELLDHSLLFLWNTIVSTLFWLLLGNFSILELVPYAC